MIYLPAALCSFILCDNISHDQGKFSLMGVFYRVHVLSYPAKKRCYVILGWYGEEGKHYFSLRFLSSERSRVLLEMSSYPFSLEAHRPYSNGIIQVELPFEEEGTYWFEVLLDGESRGYFPVFVETVGETTGRLA
ncbi:MAG: hypothetical protein VR69_13870 [Peptococcaceae bacterium BRH_c4b]|nr:MAG: hypothetical protein VR69_13870 [Peptococcaceae bacterium BRH_c4b]